MKIANKFDKVILLLLVALSSIVGLFFYLASIDRDVESYDAIHSKIIKLKLINKDFNSFALSIDTFLEYNKLNEDIKKFEILLKELKDEINKQYPNKALIAKELMELKESFTSKVDNLEYFKSLNSTLINTSHFLFDLQKRLRENENITQQSKALLNETLFYLLKFSSTDYIDKDFIIKKLQEIKKLSNRDTKLIHNFYTHAKRMLSTLETLKEISKELRNGELDNKLETLHSTIAEIHTRNIFIEKEITTLFFLFAILLIFFLLKTYRASLKIRQELYAFEFAVKNSDNTIVLTDPNKHITYVNKVFEKTTGYSAKEAIGQNPNILKSGKQDDAFYRELNAKLAKGEKWEGQFINKRKDGSLYYEKASIVPIVLDNQLLSYLAIKLDITEYVLQNQELALAASVFENTEEAIIITDTDKRTVSVNGAFEKIYGYTLEEIQGKTLNMIRSGKQDVHFYKQMWNAIESEGVWQGKLFNKTKSGQIIPVWSTIKAVKDKDGKLINYIAVQTDLREIEGIQDEINYLAYHDQLTGLYNRAHFEEYLHHAIALAKRKGEHIALLFIDLDRFKIINDTLGHDIGDEVLVEVAKRLQNTLRESDFISRWGGDEFVVILENINQSADSAKTASHLINILKEPIEIATHSLTTTASIGITLYPENGEDANTLIKHADSAMYLAKETGKNQFQFYTQALSKEIQSKMDIDIALRNALKNEEFFLVFQPQYALDTREIVSLEALIRWNNANKELTYPDRFIPIAEENGAIVDIGYFVFEESCRALNIMRENGLNIHYIAVNVASMQFNEDNLLDIFLSILERYHLTPSDIEIEITERFVMEPTRSNITLLERFRSHGFRISIDDFGTGYSSMAYLKNLPADTIKIDKTFVDDINKGGADNAIIEAIIALAKTLEYSIVAEGIEREVEEEFLREHNCDYGQGYLFCRPILATELIERFTKA